MIRLNPDKEIVDMVRAYQRAHSGDCPCQVDAKCMCDSFKQQESGWCHCLLYKKTKEN